MQKTIFSLGWRLDHDRIIHSLKTAFACGLGFFIGWVAKFPVDQWLLITILVVMCAQISVGGLLQKSYMRLLGTICGSAIAILTILIIGVQPVTIVVVTCLAAFLFSYMATSPSPYSDSGTLGAVTVAVILVAKQPDLHSAFYRFAEITLGIFVAFLVSQFLFPMHARSYLRREIIANFQRLGELYQKIYAAPADNEIQEIEDTIRLSLVNQRKLIKEASRESLTGKFNTEIFTKIVRCQRNILRAMNFIGSTVELSGEGKAFLQDSKELAKFNLNVSSALTSVEKLLVKDVASPANKAFNLDFQWIENLKSALYKTKESLTMDDLQQINIFLYCAKVIAENLNELEVIVREI